jgi:hypothetical protein
MSVDRGQATAAGRSGAAQFQGGRFVDPVARVIGDAGEDVAQIDLRIEIVEGRGLDEGIENGGPATAGVRAGEQVVLAVMSTST